MHDSDSIFLMEEWCRDVEDDAMGVMVLAVMVLA
jgi:hypothetical protein